MQNHMINSDILATLPTIRVAVVDGHPLFRTGTIQALTTAHGIEIAGEGATATDALRIARELSPDVMLLDLRLPGGGVEVIATITRDCPKVRIVVLTASENEDDVTSSLQAGAQGYILKGSSGLDVIKTVRAIAQGNSYVAPSLAAQLLIKGSQIKAVVKKNPHDLTSREDEIFGFVSRGMSNKEIARCLNCTERTVKHHMTNIMQKLHVRNRVQAALKFAQMAA
jgi:two-component system, NarL family, nitrate/nitrite response regulator NarL